jgi:type II secretory pathway component PulL
MFRSAVVVVALLLAGPTLWTAFVNHQISTNTALIRLLIAIPAAAVLVGIFWMITGRYHRERQAEAESAQSAQAVKSERP